MTVVRASSLTHSGAVLVVGSGPAGLSVALRLADLGRPVIVIESGGNIGDEHSPASLNAQLLNTADVVGLPFRADSGRWRGLGGAGQLWHGQCVRLRPMDCEPREWIANSGWPLPTQELDRYYPRAERWLDVSGHGYDAARWAEHPRLPAYQWDERLLEHDFTEYAKNYKLGDRYRRRLHEDPRIELVLNTSVSRLLVENRLATGVEVIALDGTKSTVAASRVVVAAGAIENARLLQLSDPMGVGLGDGREHVGRWLQDHPAIRTAEVHPSEWQSLQDRYTAVYRRGRKMFPKVRLSAQAQRDHGLLDATAVFVHEHDGSATDAARKVVSALAARQMPAASSVKAAAGGVPSLGRAAWRRYARGLSGGMKPTRVWLQVWLEQEPDAGSRVTLSDQRDRQGLRRSNIDWHVGELEMRTSRMLTRWIGSELVRLGHGHLDELDVMASDDAWRAQVLDAYHPAGTARMSVTAADGVVDTDLAVHGIDGLFVLGSSAFPTVGFANPTLTIAALGLRLADHLARH